MRAIRAHARVGFTWINCGWHMVRHDRELWLGMAVIYLLLAYLLRLIPFMGDLVLVLLTPLLLAGALLTARAREARHAGIAPPGSAPAAGAPWRRYLDDYLRLPARHLFQIFRHEDKIVAAVLVAILTLGLVMLAKIAEYLLVGGSALAGLNPAELAAAARPATLLGLLVATTLYVALTMGLFYLVPLTMLGDMPPMAAIAESFSACVRNALPLALFTTAFFLLYALIAAAFGLAHWLGYLLVFSLGPVALSVFVAGVYCSYKNLYG